MSRKARIGLLGAMTALAIPVAFSSSTMAQSEPYCPPNTYLVTQKTELSFGIQSSHANQRSMDDLVCLEVLPLATAQGPFPCNVNSVPNEPIPDRVKPRIWTQRQIIRDVGSREDFAETCPFK
jgi:hypothetical protein